MKKDTFFFRHDFAPTSDPKIQAMIGEHGALGYGLFWRIVEMLHSDTDHVLAFKEYTFLAISKQMSTSVEQVKVFVNDCITTYELFEADGVNFWSERVNRNIEERKEISVKRSFAGKKSAETKKNSTLVEQDATNANKGKERKGNEKKVVKAFMPPLLGEVEAYFQEKGYTNESAVRAWHYYEELDWIDSNGKPIQSWKGKMISTWMKEENKITVPVKKMVW